MFDVKVKKIYQVTIETLMQSSKVHICCLISDSLVIAGCYIFNNDTINGQNCHLMLK